MPPYADIYVITQSRTEATVAGFLDRFAPVRKEVADEYCIPQYGDSPQTTFYTAAEVVAYCCSHPSEPQSVYWRRVGEGDPAYAMVFFTRDGFLILGLSTDESTAERYLAELRTQAVSNTGYVTVENPPPETMGEFLEMTKRPSLLAVSTNDGRPYRLIRVAALAALIAITLGLLTTVVVGIGIPMYQRIRTFSVEDRIHGTFFPVTRALYAYAEDHGRPAESLDAVLPKYIETIPSSELADAPAYRVLPDGRSWELAIRSRALSQPRLYICRSTQLFSPEETRRIILQYHSTWTVLATDK